MLSAFWGGVLGFDFVLLLIVFNQCSFVSDRGKHLYKFKTVKPPYLLVPLVISRLRSIKSMFGCEEKFEAHFRCFFQIVTDSSLLFT